MLNCLLMLFAYAHNFSNKWNTIVAIYLQGTSGDAAGGIFCIGFIILIIVVLVISSNNKQKALTQASAAYQQSLARLKANPTNADLRQKTLALGRVYSNLTRNKKGVTIYDEMALMNDINAACAGVNFTSQTSRPPSAPRSVEERLSRLSELKSKGLIDEQEYNLRRQKILDDI